MSSPSINAVQLLYQSCMCQFRSWKAGHFLPIELTQVFRQTDSTFVDLLAELRMGRVSDNSRCVVQPASFHI